MSKINLRADCFFFNKSHHNEPYCIARERKFVDAPYQCEFCKWYIPKDSAYTMVKSMMMLKCFMNHRYK